MSQMQEQAAEMKKKLDETLIETEIENGLVKVKANGNKTILSIDISNDIINDNWLFVNYNQPFFDNYFI